MNQRAKPVMGDRGMNSPGEIGRGTSNGGRMSRMERFFRQPPTDFQADVGLSAVN
jgi:hypothetical protein